MEMQWQVLLAVVTVAGSGGFAAWITAWSRRSVDKATGRKTDIEAAVLLLGEHRKDNADLREQIGVLKSETETNRREAGEIRVWAIDMGLWAQQAVAVIEQLNGHIVPPPAPPERRRATRGPAVAPHQDEEA